MPNVPARTTYDALIADISVLYDGARKALVTAYWQIGQRIVEVEQDGAVKAEYGSGLLQKISDDLARKLDSGCSIESLRKMRRFYLLYPNQPPAADLSWSHHLELLPVKDQKWRRSLERRIVKEGLGRDELRRLVHQEAPADEPVVSKALAPLKRPADLRLLTFGEVTGKQVALSSVAEGDVLLDCGFFVALAVSAKQAGAVTLTSKPSYTYAAKVERVVDGDTLLVVLDLGFGASVREKLRLRGINTPELGTPQGEKAKKAVAGLFPAGTAVIVKSHKTDVYGRFVADVFCFGKDSSQNIPRRPGDLQGAGAEGNGEVWLNQYLLDEGLAVRMAE